MAAKYFINLNFVCNERCIFCAANLANNTRTNGQWPSLTMDELRAWLGGTIPGPADAVMLAGGEPTLHRDLVPIIELLSSNQADVTIFTNGLRFADPAFARKVLAAGTARVEIALFGATAERHEAVTRVPGSFERTIKALQVLSALKSEYDFILELRLLVSRQSYADSPDIVRIAHERVTGIDAVSLNRLILSDDAASVDATVSWEEVRGPINEAARLIRGFGYTLVYHAAPFCIFDEDNLEYVQADQARLISRATAGLDPVRREMRYLDPGQPEGKVMPNQPMGKRVLPRACLTCDFLATCGRVEDWYVARYGAAGIHPLRRSAAFAAAYR